VQIIQNLAGKAPIIRDIDNISRYLVEAFEKRLAVDFIGS
jgi:hypothetical protein